MKKLVLRIFLIFGIFLIFCSCQYQEIEYISSPLSLKQAVASKAILFPPMLVEVDYKGLPLKKINKNYIRNFIEDSLVEIAFPLFKKRMFSNLLNPLLFEKVEAQKLRNIFIKNHSKILKNAKKISKEEREELVSFYKKTKLKYAIIPFIAKVYLNNLSNTGVNPEVTIKLAMHYQMWDISTGNIICEKVVFSEKDCYLTESKDVTFYVKNLLNENLGKFISFILNVSKN